MSTGSIKNEQSRGLYRAGYIYPRAMGCRELLIGLFKLLTHFGELPIHDDELVDGSPSQYASKKHDAPIGQTRVFNHFVKSHRFPFFILSLGLSVCAIFCLTFGVYSAIQSNTLYSVSLYIGLAVLFFSLVFAFAHWSYE